MAWTYNNRVIREGRSWTDDAGVTHPTNWGSWSTEDKTAAGLVFEADPAPFDSRFFWDANTPKALDDVTTTDDNGDDLVTKGLKSTFKAQVKAQANSLLKDTDWYITRNAEKSTSVPVGVSLYRSAVRKAEADMESAIDSAADHGAFVALFTATEDTPAAVGNWPDSDIMDVTYDTMTADQRVHWRSTAKVTMRQARLALSQQGFASQINDALALIPEPDKSKVQTEWEYSSVVERGSVWVAVLQPALGLTDEQMDDLFNLASTL